MQFENKNIRFKTIFIFFFTLFIFLIITTTYIYNKIELEYSKMEQLVTLKTQKIEGLISDYLYKAQTLSALVIKNDGEIEDFEKVASNLIDSEIIRNVILAPNGIVTHVYPLDSNEGLIGMNMFSDVGGSKEAIQAKETGKLILGGPFDLVQGGQALAGRMPVYLGEISDENFWGIISVTLNYPEVLRDAELDDLKLQDLAFELFRTDPDTGEKQIIANSNYNYDHNAKSVTQTLNIGNVYWLFSLSPIKSWYQYAETWILLIVGFGFSLLLAYILQYSLKLKVITNKLDYIANTDPLTGILNRRGLFNILEEMIVNHDKFYLIYMDIDKFKLINDTYGHDCGNEALINFSNTIKSHLDSHSLFARIGGDEFIIVLKKEHSDKEVNNLIDTLKKHLHNLSKRHKYTLEFSYGIANYPNDGNSLDDLLVCSDTKMYNNKANKQTI